jgi:hypothetical protein
MAGPRAAFVAAHVAAEQFESRVLTMHETPAREQVAMHHTAVAAGRTNSLDVGRLLPEVA